MAKVKLGEVAREYKATVKDAVDLPVVGLEHLIPGQVELTQWSEDADNTFTKGFKKGQMLFGRRRAYLKKAALAPFDGICSGDITVIEAIPERIMPELLPFVIQNDSLFDYAVEKSAGSLSPRVKWEHLKNYEFELPEMEHQSELVDLLWAMARTKKAYQELVKKTDELVKSQFIEMFGDPEKNTLGLEYVQLGDIAFITKLAGFEYTKYIKYQDSGDIIMIRGLNCKGTKLVLDDLKWIDRNTSNLLPRSKLYKGDIVITYVGTVGEIGLIDKDDTYHLAPNVAKLSLNDKSKEIPAFWAYMLMISRDYLVRFATSTTQAALNMERIRNIGFINPPTEQQEQFVELLEQSDKSKFELTQAISRIDDMIKALMQG